MQLHAPSVDTVLGGYYVNYVNAVKQAVNEAPRGGFKSSALWSSGSDRMTIWSVAETIAILMTWYLPGTALISRKAETATTS